MAEVRINNLYKKFGSTTVLNGINLTIEEKKFYVFVGPSGCGKTTLLRLIAGLETPDKGDIYIDGINVNDHTPAKRDVAMVFQNYALYPHMNVFGNLSYALKLKKTPKSEIKKRVVEIAELLEIDKLLSRKPKELSGGQKQRVALGRAIIRKPKVFLFDEPLSNLDANLRSYMRKELVKLQHNLDTTVIYVTHDQTEAMTMGHKIVVLNEGVVQQAGEPQGIYDKPLNTFVARFIGAPSMNLIEGRLTKQNEMYRFTNDSFALPINSGISALKDYIGKKVLLGIRPGHVSLCDQCDNNGIRMMLEMVEKQGHINVLEFKDRASHLLVLTPHSGNIGEFYMLNINLTRAHIFDIRSTLRLT